MILEIRVPISPTPNFFKQVEYLYKSAITSAAPDTNVRMVVSVGADIEPFDIGSIQTWADKNVTWRWVPRDEFRDKSFQATGSDRLKFQSDADFILMADADTMFIRGVEDLLAALRQTPAIAGVIAHVPPFNGQQGKTWADLYKRLDIDLPRDLYQHTGWGSLISDPKTRFSPAYYNFGAVFIPAIFMKDLARSFNVELAKAALANVGYFQGQLALTLSIYKLDLPRIALEPRYNFPNDPDFEKLFPQDLCDIRILHYLRLDEIQRDKIWESPESLAAFLARRDLRPSNEILRRRIEFINA